VTKETKIGLLVGLAFIILFAIILSEKGAGPRPQGSPQFTRVEPTSRTPERGGPTFTNAGKLPFPVEPVRPESPRQTAAKPPALPPVAVAPPAAERLDDVALPTLDPALISGSQTAASGTKGGESTGVVADWLDRMKSADQPGAVGMAGTTVAQSSNRTGGPGGRAETLQAKLDTLAARTSAAPEAVPPTDPDEIAAQPPPTPDAQTDVYIVLPGDTLTSIAKRVCGHCGPSAIDAICMANAGTIKDRNSLVVGQKLIVPRATGRIVTASGSAETAPNAGLSDGPRSKSKPDAKAQTASARRRHDEAAPAAARVYQVKPKDTLSRIAKEQLGDARRYREIVELNRGVLGKGDRLLPGMKLKLPPRGEASSTRRGDTEPSARAAGDATIAL
jgi:nucleoid-associated protein YgaU